MAITDWIQVISTLILVGVTAFMRDLSKDAKRQADASVKMAEEIEKQRYDTVRPVIDIELSQEPKDLMELGYSEERAFSREGYAPFSLIEA